MCKKFFLLFFLCISVSLFSQVSRPKLYFDKNGKSSSENLAYYYRQESDTGMYFKSYFVANGRLAFQGGIKSASPGDENRNVYYGKCIWYYKNGNVKQERTFNDDGEETGTSRYFHESGKTAKEINFVKGRMADNFYVEYSEDGARTRIFEDDFINNHNEWDLYVSDKSSSLIEEGMFKLVSNTREGTSRFINYPIQSEAYTIEADCNISDIKGNDRVGLIYGFKDWQNYHYFAITKKNFYIGSVYEGVKSNYVDAMYSSAINLAQANTIKIICNGENSFYSINGEVQYKDQSRKLFGSNFGFIVSGNAKLKVDRFVLKELNADDQSVTVQRGDMDVKATGSGVIFSSQGYILTNHHVIENSTKFVIDVTDNISGKKSYKAELVIQDKDNDLAILKIKDDAFTSFSDIKYAFKENGLIDVGSSVFTIGYPHALTGMGKGAKFTDGKVSSKTGYNGSINAFQTTIPVQPGNSGGPVFNENGQLVGIINATFREADNVSYAIKLNYIKNLIELLPDQIELPMSSVISNLSLEEKLKVLSNYVVLVKVK